MADEKPVQAEPGEHRERSVSGDERDLGPGDGEEKLGWSIDRIKLRTIAVASTISGTSTADRQCGSPPGSAMPRPILRGRSSPSGR